MTCDQTRPLPLGQHDRQALELKASLLGSWRAFSISVLSGIYLVHSPQRMGELLLDSSARTTRNAHVDTRPLSPRGRHLIQIPKSVGAYLIAALNAE
jgi:hypothetical protein